MDFDYSLMNIPFLLKEYYPDAKYSCHDRTYEGIEWLDENIKKPELADLKAKHREQIRIDLNHKALQEKKNAKIIAEAHEESEKQIESHLKDEALKDEMVRKQTLKMKSVIAEVREYTRQEQKQNAAEDYWRELTEDAQQRRSFALTYLRDTDWYVLRKAETGREIPEDVLQNRQKYREDIDKGNLVFKNYDQLRRKEYPTKEEKIEAFKKGAEAIIELRKRYAEVNKKYKAPKR